MTTITETRLKCDWCDAVSPVIGDEQPLGWVNNHELNFCTVEHQELYLDRLYAKHDIEPIVCSYCGRRLDCRGPDSHRGQPWGVPVTLAAYGTWRLVGHEEWTRDIQKSGTHYFCTHEHLDLWCEEHK